MFQLLPLETLSADLCVPLTYPIIVVTFVWAIHYSLALQDAPGTSCLFPAPVLCMHAKLLQLCLTLRDPMDCSPPGSSIHGILQAKILEWIAVPSSRGSSWPSDGIRVLESVIFPRRPCSFYWKMISETKIWISKFFNEGTFKGVFSVDVLLAAFTLLRCFYIS